MAKSKMHLSFFIPLVLFFILINPTLAFNLGWKGQDRTTSTHLQATISEDISGGLHAGPNFYEILKPYFALAKNELGSPTCQSIATAALRHSCAAFSSSEAGTAHLGADQVISQSLMVYGARLAVCELREANAPVPGACKSFAPNEKITKKRTMSGHFTKDGLSDPTELYPAYDEVTTTDTAHCVSALWPKEQSWVSYSNSKQNAVQLCGALQGVVQNQNTVRQLGRLAQAAAGLSEQLVGAPQQYRDSMHQVMEDLHHHSVERKQRLDNGLQEIQDRVAAWAVQFMNGLDTQFFALFSGAADSVQEDLQSVQRTANDIAADLANQRTSNADIMNQIAYTRDLLIHDVLQEVGKVSLSIKDQHDVIQSSRSSLAQLKSTIDDTTSHANTLSDGLEAAIDGVGAFSKDIRDLNTEMKDLEAHIGPLRSVLGVANWHNLAWWARKAFICVVSTTVIGLWSFAILAKIAALPVIGNVCGATGTGFALGVITAFYFDPTELFEASATDIFEDDLSARKQVTFGLIIGIVSTLACVMLYSAAREHFEKNHLWPASRITVAKDATYRKWMV